MNLSELGWDSFFEAAFAKHRALGCQPARVAVEDKHAYVLLGEEGSFSGKVAGRLLRRQTPEADLPKVGDWVAVGQMASESSAAVIQAVLPRRTKLARKVPGRQVREQVLAANVHVAFVVQALDPTFNPRRLERFMLMVHEGGARPVAVLNKTDLCDALDGRLAEASRVAGTAPVLPVCALSGRGLKQLREFIRPTETVAFIGPSGVGKSSLINRLYGEDIQATIEVRESDARGRHTTTWRELIQLPGGGLVIDTPGLREVQVGMADAGIEETFPDIATLSVGCHFRDCSHTVEKRCAIQAALAAGHLPRERYESFVKLKRELDYLAEERQKHTYLARQRAARAARRAYNQEEIGRELRAPGS
jgi:ribosome biogenesis GTPase / thiamine phosphate phosphatase